VNLPATFKVNKNYPVLLLSDFFLAVDQNHKLLPFKICDYSSEDGSVVESACSVLQPSCLDLSVTLVGKRLTSDSIVLFSGTEYTYKFSCYPIFDFNCLYVVLDLKTGCLVMLLIITEPCENQGDM